MSTESLYQIWARLKSAGYETDKNSVHSYIPVYEEILAPHRENAKNVLEVGLFKGHSLRMWEQYFTLANVHGIDCSETPHGGMADLRPMIAEGYHKIHIMDATNPDKVKQEFGQMLFDVIIEDCNHSVVQQLELYKVFSQYLSPNSIYIIEDIENIDESRSIFENIDESKNVTIIDNRAIKNRFDDVLVIITNK